MGEAQYIELCRKGDRRAFKQLYQEYAPYLYTICRRYGVGEAECPDMLQEVFAEVFTSIDRFDASKGKLKPWIRSIGVHKILASRRGRTLEVVHLTEQHDWSGAENEALKKLKEDDLMRLVNSMPEGYRVVFNLYVVDGYSHEEIHKLLGIKAETSRSQLMRARKWLQRNLDDFYGQAAPKKSSKINLV